MVKEAFDGVYNDIADMNKSVQEMTGRLQNTKQQIKPLLEHTATLQDNRYSLFRCKLLDLKLITFSALKMIYKPMLRQRSCRHSNLHKAI